MVRAPPLDPPRYAGPVSARPRVAFSLLLTACGAALDDDAPAAPAPPALEYQAGTPAADTLVTASERATLVGGHGDDALAGGRGGDALDGGFGADRIAGQDGDDLALGGPGNDVIAAGAGDDDVDAGSGDDTVLGDDGADRVNGGPGEDALAGGAGDDRLFGGLDDDTLDGDAGDDQLAGGAGDDVLRGGDGDDTFHPGPGKDEVLGGDGNDTVILRNPCELAAGEVFDGGPGDDQLYTPLTLDELAAADVRVVDFETVRVVPPMDAVCESHDPANLLVEVVGVAVSASPLWYDAASDRWLRPDGNAYDLGIWTETIFRVEEAFDVGAAAGDELRVLDAGGSIDTAHGIGITAEVCFSPDLRVGQRYRVRLREVRDGTGRIVGYTSESYHVADRIDGLHLQLGARGPIPPPAW